MLSFSFLVVLSIISSVICIKVAPPKGAVTSSTTTTTRTQEDHYDDFVHRPGMWDEKDLDSLFSANKKWANRIALENPKYFEANKIGQSPKVLWIGCSDARVPANEMFGTVPGSVFVHRNIANMVVNTDFSLMSIIHYAVDVLKVKHIVVCGHYDCGGVKAAMENTDFKAPLQGWLTYIRDTYRLHKDEIMAIPDKKGRQRRLIELNAIEQAVNVLKASHVQKRRVESAETQKRILRYINTEAITPSKLPFTEPQVHACVFEPTTGELTMLDISDHVMTHIQEISTVYSIY